MAALVAEPTAERSELVNALRRALSRNPLQASAKAALAFRGLPVRGDVRAPLLELRLEQTEALRAELEELVPALIAHER